MIPGCTGSRFGRFVGPEIGGGQEEGEDVSVRQDGLGKEERGLVVGHGGIVDHAASVDLHGHGQLPLGQTFHSGVGVSDYTGSVDVVHLV